MNMLSLINLFPRLNQNAGDNFDAKSDDLNVFCMPDWNPAEIIGTAPSNLL